jgi:Protein of unknown function (DUF2934)
MFATKEVDMIESKEVSREVIAHRAYELYVERGSEAGKDVEDWVRAEKELAAGPVFAPTKTKASRASQTN